VKVCNIYKKQM